MTVRAIEARHLSPVGTRRSPPYQGGHSPVLIGSGHSSFLIGSGHSFVLLGRSLSSILHRKWSLSPVLTGSGYSLLSYQVNSLTLQEEGERGRKKGRKERTGVDIISSQLAASKRFWKDSARCTGDVGDPYSVHVTHICLSLLPWAAG